MMFLEQQMSLINNFPSFSSFRTSPTKDNTSQAKSNPSKRHRILFDGGLLKLELKNKIFTM